MILECFLSAIAGAVAVIVLVDHYSEADKFVTYLRSTLTDLDARFIDAAKHGLTAADAYDSFFQGMVSDVLRETAGSEHAD